MIRKPLLFLPKLSHETTPPNPPPPIPDPEDWLKYTVYISIFILAISAALTLIKYIFQKDSRRVLGSITLVYTLFCLGLAAFWSFAFRPHSQKFDSFLAFGTLFCIYMCVFYQISFIWYLWSFFKYRKRNWALLDLQPEISSQNHQPQDLQAAFIHRGELQTIPRRLRDKYNSLVQTCQILQQGYVHLNEKDVIRNEKIQALQNSIKNSPLKNKILKIHSFALVIVFCLTIMSTLIEPLGVGYYGDCTVQWEAKIQNRGVILFLSLAVLAFLTGVNSCIVFNQKNYQERLELLTNTPALTLDEKQEEYHLKYFRKVVILMTIFSCLFLTTNIYASQENTKDVEERWKNAGWKIWTVIYFTMPAIQSLIFSLLKICEPK